MAMFRKAAEFLGLVDDDAGDDYAADDGYLDGDGYDEREYGNAYDAPAPARTRDEPTRPERPLRAQPEPGSGSVMVVRGGDRSEPATLVPQGAAITPRPASADSPTVRSIPAAPAASVHVIEPRSFNDAQEIGDRLKATQPVIVNLQGNDRELQRRLIDFASGLCYALNGTMSKVADQVFLLTPVNVDVSDAEVERLSSRGLYRSR